MLTARGRSGSSLIIIFKIPRRALDPTARSPAPTASFTLLSHRTPSIEPHLDKPHCYRSHLHRASILHPPSFTRDHPLSTFNTSDPSNPFLSLPITRCRCTIFIPIRTISKLPTPTVIEHNFNQVLNQTHSIFLLTYSLQPKPSLDPSPETNHIENSLKSPNHPPSSLKHPFSHKRPPNQYPNHIRTKIQDNPATTKKNQRNQRESEKE
ncbi:hypothetical protein V6N11_058476 [Hibiscus sabdariffa]|uniref:Uncharacterized protein n=1 Tax=Hibiscus sabdariffa TaxID=183260 RepID=A0ABR2U4C5_9ROSI